MTATLTIPLFTSRVPKICLKIQSFPLKPTSNPLFSSRFNLSSHSKTMDSSIKSVPSSSSSDETNFWVPSLESNEIDRIVEETFGGYSDLKMQRRGEGVAIVWFRNDLRVLDNEALCRAWVSSKMVLPVYCVDPRLFGGLENLQCRTWTGWPNVLSSSCIVGLCYLDLGAALRAQFLMECLVDLRKNLIKLGSNLLIRHGKPEDIIPSLAQTFGAHTVYAHKETCSEELLVEQLVSKGLQQVTIRPEGQKAKSDQKSLNPKLQLIWGSTMYHIDDLPFTPANLPDVYTQFRKSVESKCTIRGCLKLPSSLGPLPSSNLNETGEWGYVPSLRELGLQEQKANYKRNVFHRGESAALGRVNEYFWSKDMLKVYKETRNGMLGPNYSTKFSPWLAFGCLSPRFVYEEVKRYEKERIANDSTYWYPLIDANMKELSATGFMSNRGRQIVCSFLVRDMGIDWRMGAEWFETCLLDYDPCSNYGNWTYGAGVGNDPREDRYFSIPKQAQNYDPEGEYVAFWLPELQRLPKEKRHFPGISYTKQVVPLKFGNTSSGSSRARTPNQSTFMLVLNFDVVDLPMCMLSKISAVAENVTEDFEDMKGLPYFPLQVMRKATKSLTHIIISAISWLFQTQKFQVPRRKPVEIC
ncbi:hypothetical protein Scep_023182 [Stephania cephalantha]|uniref:Photolyase/cryptochrome alpha/beta domain-containing protein n=1 Tax=Stephania cephalantha TaxID=152367 RepID=A0AAP0EZM2_9MAGN